MSRGRRRETASLPLQERPLASRLLPEPQPGVIQRLLRLRRRLQPRGALRLRRHDEGGAPLQPQPAGGTRLSGVRGRFYARSDGSPGPTLSPLCVVSVYECGPWCGCDRTRCQNRLVQRGIRVRLQVFQTDSCGWGVRCRDDLDRGTFVCTYAGEMASVACEPAAAEI